jgi:hypothetical protein
MGASLRLRAAWIIGIASLSVFASAGQVRPPSGGQISTVAVEGTIDAVSPEGNSLSVRTTDGTTQLFRLLERMFVHGIDPNDELIGLAKGTPVVIHYSGSGSSATVQEVDRIDGNGLNVTEGIVTAIDRGRGEITVRYDNHKSETLKLTNRAATDSGREITKADRVRVIVYYTNKRGVKEVHYFRKKP